jgi:hypothetical protein
LLSALPMCWWKLFNQLLSRRDHSPTFKLFMALNGIDKIKILDWGKSIESFFKQ